MNNSGYEIERKFLIAIPSKDILSSCEDASEIIQTYLKAFEVGISERVRKRGTDNKWTYTHTRKMHLSDIRRIEIEEEISENEYNELLKKADASKNVIHKTRYCLNFEEQLFEIDIFPFWNDRAFMEIELSDENQVIVFPPDIVIAREVTGDKRYTNHALAGNIPVEPLF